MHAENNLSKILFYMAAQITHGEHWSKEKQRGKKKVLREKSSVEKGDFRLVKKRQKYFE